MIGSLIKNYKIVEKLNEIGSVSHYKAVDEVLDRPVYIKFLDKQHSEQEEKKLRCEAAILAKLVHPCVPTLHTLTDLDGRLFMISEFLEGEPLNKYSVYQDNVSTEKTVSVFARVLDCLEFGHAAEIPHGDLKIKDIFLTKAGDVKVLNFGTLEEINPKFEIAAEKDIQAVGKILFETLTGKVMFSVKAEEIRQTLRTANPAIPEKLINLVAEMVQPDGKVQSVGEIRSQLVQLLEKDEDLALPSNIDAEKTSEVGSDVVFSIDFSKSEKKFDRKALQRQWSKKRVEVKTAVETPFNWRLAKNNLLVAGAGVAAIFVLHFFFQISFIQNETVQMVDDLTKTEPVGKISHYQETFAERIAEPEINVERIIESKATDDGELKYSESVEAKTDTAEVKPKKYPALNKSNPVSPNVQIRQKAAPSRTVTRKKESSETRSERLRRAEKMLTGV